MKVLQWIVIFSLCLEHGLTKRGVDPEAVGSDAWIYCHGMPMDVFKKACACMLKLKSFMAEKYGQDTKTVDHWPISGDRLYSQDDCIDEMDKVFSIRKKRRKKRKFYNMFKHLWVSPIPYSFHPDVTAQDKITIVAAIAHWMNQTCISYVYEPDYDPKNKTVQRAFFTASSDGCYSYIGKQNPISVFPQQINLKTGACTAWMGVVVHEIGHSLGLFHEQNRMDRESWIIFYAENVDPGTITNFDLEPFSQDFGVPYDYGSVMQYDNKAFSVNGRAVLETILPHSEYTLGQRGHLSFLDAKIANRAYCGEVCANMPALPCKHGGYMDPKDCRKCRCPEGLGGRLCETAAPSDPECIPRHSVLEAGDQVQCLKSPGYDTEFHYPQGVECSWIIQAPRGEFIRGHFSSDFGIYCMGGRHRGPICFHWVEIKYKIDKETRGARICCQKEGKLIWNDPGIIVSESNEMIVHFDATYPRTKNSYTAMPRLTQRIGFQFCFALNSATPAPIIVNATDTTVEKPWWLDDEAEDTTTTPEVVSTNQPTNTESRELSRDTDDFSAAAVTCVSRLMLVVILIVSALY